MSDWEHAGWNLQSWRREVGILCAYRSNLRHCKGKDVSVKVAKLAAQVNPSNLLPVFKLDLDIDEADECK